jgi:UDP-N-acetylmuramate--alanine ligase
LDEVILTEIYPAREQPIEGVTSALIYDNLRPGIEKHMVNKDDVLSYIKQHNFDVLIVLGAGDLDNQVPEMARILKEKR